MKWDDLKKTPMAPPLALSPERMAQAEEYVKSIPHAELERRGKVMVAMQMGWLEQRWEDTRCPCAAFEAWRLCREAGMSAPAFLMEAMDEIAEAGLTEQGTGGNKRRLRAHKAWLDGQWRAVFTEWRKGAKGESNTEARNVVAERTASSYTRVTEAHNFAVKSAMSANPPKRG